MKWISFIIEIAACIISFGICTAVIRAQFRPRDELAWWKYLVFGITFTAAIGAKQFVVQEAAEMIVSEAFNVSWFVL